MKLMHLSDLHIGKRVNEYNLMEDQKFILNKILGIIDETKPDAVLIAGDVYDKSMPSADAVELFDWFLSSIAGRKIPCLVISGNHDSPERIAFGSTIMSGQGIYMSPVFDGTIGKVTLTDDHGAVHIYRIPFVKPAHVRACYPDEAVESFDEAMASVLDKIQVDANERNVLMVHQFITGSGTEPERSESEAITVGGTDNINMKLFDAYDYVALGHLHKAQSVGRETVRYSGSPLKYSFSECRHEKSVTLVHLGRKGEVSIEKIPLIPIRDMREIKGPISEILSKDTYEGTNTDDYVRVILTDEDEVIDAIGQVKSVYPHVMRLEFDNLRSRTVNTKTAADNIDEKSELSLFAEFYKLQNLVEPDDEKMAIVSEIFEKIGGVF